MNDKSKYYLYKHTQSSVQSIRDFTVDLSSIAYGFDAKELLLYQDENGDRNIDKLFRTYGDDEDTDEINFKISDVEYQTSSSLEELPLKYGTYFALDLKKINTDLLGIEGNQVVDYQKFSAFFAAQLYYLLKDKNYKRTIQANKKSVGVIKNIFHFVSVWVWCKSLQSDGGDVLINLSPFVKNLNTSVSKSGGTFSFSLPPIQGIYENGKWKINSETYRTYGSEYVSQNNSSFISSDSTYMFENFYFHNIIKENDVVFIRFEKLDIENDREKSFYEIGKEELPNKIYDMIGLVDTNSISYQSQSNDVSIQINGRDLIKLFIEDGVYLYATGYANGGVFANETDEDFVRRYDGQILTLYQFSLKTVDSVLKFIINTLGVISVTSKNLFSAYGYSKDLDGEYRDRRSYSYFIPSTSYEVQNNYIEGINANMEFAKENIASSRLQDNLTNQSDEAETLQIDKLFGEINDFFKAADNSGVLSNGNWGAFVFNAENLKKSEIPTFLKNALYSTESKFLKEDTTGVFNNLIPQLAQDALNACYTYYELSKRFSEYDTPREKELLEGIWQIFKIVVDESIANRRIADSSIGNENGSLINSIKKICQEPFVEFFTDTYGDQFYAVIRKLPFDKKGFIDIMNSTINTEFKDGVKSSDDIGIMIEIEPEDLLSMNLTFDNSSSYSWYKLTPQNMLAGSDNTMAFAYIRAIYFKQYAEIFGSKPFDTVSNYIDFYPSKDKDEKLNVAYFIQQAIRDLKFMIDSNAYIPFTRKGSITLNGDRRIKIGTVVYNKFTNEVCYVDKVDQSYSVDDKGTVDRTTVLQVSRCMIKDFIEGKYVNKSDIYSNYQTASVVNKDGRPLDDSIFVSYFSIVETPIDDSVFYNEDFTQSDFNNIVINTWKVNEDIFRFFLNNAQFGLGKK